MALKPPPQDHKPVQQAEPEKESFGVKFKRTWHKYTDFDKKPEQVEPTTHRRFAHYDNAVLRNAPENWGDVNHDSQLKKAVTDFSTAPEGSMKTVTSHVAHVNGTTEAYCVMLQKHNGQVETLRFISGGAGRGAVSEFIYGGSTTVTGKRDNHLKDWDGRVYDLAQTFKGRGGDSDPVIAHPIARKEGGSRGCMAYLRHDQDHADQMFGRAIGHKIHFDPAAPEVMLAYQGRDTQNHKMIADVKVQKLAEDFHAKKHDLPSNGHSAHNTPVGDVKRDLVVKR